MFERTSNKFAPEINCHWQFDINVQTELAFLAVRDQSLHLAEVYEVNLFGQITYVILFSVVAT